MGKSTRNTGLPQTADGAPFSHLLIFVVGLEEKIQKLEAPESNPLLAARFSILLKEEKNNFSSRILEQVMISEFEISPTVSSNNQMAVH